MRLISLEAETFKRLSAVYIKFPESGVFEVVGENEQGKTSVLESIMSCFGGAKYYPKKPIKAGAKGSKLILTTDELTIRLAWTEKGESLIVRAADGSKIDSPQTLLNKLFAKIAFDPLEFSRMKPRDQAVSLRKAIGLDTSSMDAERADLYSKRTAVNTEQRSCETQLKAIVVPADPGEVGVEKDLAEIAEEKNEITRAVIANSQMRTKLKETVEQEQRLLNLVTEYRQKLADAEKSLAECRSRCSQLQVSVPTLVDPDPSTVDAKIAAGRAHNEAVKQRGRQKEAFLRLSVDAKRITDLANAKGKESDKLTRQIETIDQTRQTLMESAQFPVVGMTVDEDNVSINGIPFEEASTSQKIRTGLVVGAAMAPELKLVLIHDGSLLDKNAMREVADYAEEKGLLVIVERIESSGNGVAVVIHDGRIETGGEI